MKIFTTILITISILLIGFNATKIDFANFENPINSIVFIQIFASLIVIMLLLVYKKSKQLVEKTKKK